MRRMCRVDGPLPLLILAAVFALAGCGGGRGDKGGKGGATTGGTGGATGGMGGGSGGAIGGAGGAIGGSGGSSAGGSGGSSAIGGSGGGGAAGSGGSAGAGGMKGIGTPEICSFTIDGALSTGIPTVGIVNWSTDLAGLSEARIEFTLDDPAADEINRGSGGKIDVAGTTHRALMLGLKPERTYTYRIVATGGGKVCTSADQTLTTGAATGAPAVIRTANDPTAQAPGFIVTCEYPDGCYNPSERPKMAYIIDSDGDVVWWTPSPSLCSKAQMDWEGANMWMIEASGGASDLHTYRIAMDGIGPSTAVPELSRAHHDIAALPGGVVAALVWVQGTSAFYASDLVERAPDGTLKTVVRLDSKIVKPPDNGLFHSNSIKYHPADDTYTVGDIYAAAYVKLTRQGKLLWQFGRNCTGVPAPKCAASDGVGEDHGHHLLANGNILIFNAGTFFPQSLPLVFPAEEYSLTETGDTLTANLVWSYGVPSVYSRILGDVQRLPNGNTLVVFSTTGQIHEVSPSGGLVQTIAGVVSPNNPRSVACFAYADFRETLYGPPPR